MIMIFSFGKVAVCRAHIYAGQSFCTFSTFLAFSCPSSSICCLRKLIVHNLQLPNNTQIHKHVTGCLRTNNELVLEKSLCASVMLSICNLHFALALAALSICRLVNQSCDIANREMRGSIEPQDFWKSLWSFFGSRVCQPKL